MLYYKHSKESDLNYTLINRQGQVRQFYIKSVAELYQSLEGGVVFTQHILVDNLAESSYTSINS